MNTEQAIIDGLHKGIRNGMKEVLSGKPSTTPVFIDFDQQTGMFFAIIDGVKTMRRRRRDLYTVLRKKNLPYEFDHSHVDNP